MKPLPGWFPLFRSIVPLLLAAAVYVGLSARYGGWSYYRSHRLPLGAPQPASPDPRIVVVGLDEATLDDPRLPRWGPNLLKRSAHARLLRELRAGETRVVGFDIAFLGASDPESDQAFRDELDRMNSVVLVAEARANAEPRDPERFLLPHELFTASPAVRLASPVVDRHAGKVLGPVMEQQLGDGRTLNALAFECYKAFTGIDDLSASFSYASAGSNKVTVVWPQRSEGAFEVVSYRDVWDGSWRQSRGTDFFRNKLVLVGSTSTLGSADILDTRAGRMPGVMVHAYATQTLLDRAGIPQAVAITHLLAGAAAVLVFLAGSRLRPLLAVVAFVAIAALPYLAAVILLRPPFRLWVDPIQPTAAVLLVGAFQLVAQTVLSRRVLERFVGTEVAEQLATRGSIRSRTQRATILFADVRGYTDLSERLSPAELMDVLNQHYRWMDGLIEKHGGRVDKHIGDALMAVFEGTRKGRGHAERALDAAHEIAHTANARSGHAAELQFGIGIHTGEISTGELGARKAEYGSVGDAVNVAARLEQSTRALATTVLLSRDTAREAGREDRLKALGPITLKGKSEPVLAYTFPGN